MSRTRRTASVPTEPAPAHRSGPLEGRLVGYRLVRRIASGARADVYLAAAERPRPTTPPCPGRRRGPHRAHDAIERATATALVALRVYEAGASDDAIASEIEAMSADATGTLPSLIDVANLDDGRCCLVVERLGGRPLSRLLAERRLSPGEAVTILAPIVVGRRRAGAHRLRARPPVHDRRRSSTTTGRPGSRARSAATPSAARRGTIGAAAQPGTRPSPTCSTRSRPRWRPPVHSTACPVPPRPAGRAPVRAVRRASVERRLFAAATPEPVRGFARAGSRASHLPARSGAAARRCGSDAAGRSHAGATARFGAGLRRAARAGCTVPTTSSSGSRPRPTWIAPTDVARPVSAMRSAPARSLADGRWPGGRRSARAAAHAGAADAAGRRRPIAGRRRPSPAADAARRGRPEQASARPPAPGDAERRRRRTAGARADADPRRGGPVAARTAGGVLRDARPRLPRRRRPAGVGDRGRRSADAIALARDGAARPATRFDPASIEVAAEMGAAVLVRAATVAGREPASLLMVRGEAGWRLREVFD